MVLEARNLSFDYHKAQKDRESVIECVSIKLESGERAALTAPSGRGKTTLCKLLAGYLTPDEGEVLLDGEPMDSYGGYCPVQMIWQQPELATNPRLQIRDIIREGDAVEERILEELGIREVWMGRYPSELSGGELQRCCIARALGRRTRFLIADEITTMLDLINQNEIWRFLSKEIEERQLGLLMVSHHKGLREWICDREITL